MDGSVTVSATGDYLRLRFADGMQHRFHAVWLRDNIAETSLLGKVSEIPVDVRIRSAKLLQGMVEISFAPDGVSTHLSVEWLQRYAYDADQIAGFHLPEAVETWDHIFATELCNWRSDDTGREARLKRFGVVFMQGIDHRTVAIAPSEQLGTAPYTAQPYLAIPPCHSLIRLCKCAPETVTLRLLDGFRLAEQLRDKSLSGFNLLSGYALRYRRALDSCTTDTAAAPVFRIAPDGALHSVRYDSRFVTPVTEVPYAKLPPFYAAYRQFIQLAKHPDLTVDLLLQPGEAVLLDNHRLMRALPPDQMRNRRYLTETRLEHCGSQVQNLRPLTTRTAVG
ncbi:TauD/TfdA family dioxygenase [Neptunicoccus sediminis]|uniref:TauD/TfdA family dioxygenase n=1 Tax=Neptunicoccus sediminis TaxID=1892596 RepID=UPI000845F11C|nr:TauD/TfdA family dioxygenase [Neptunicoccus sediminis]